MAAVVDTLGMAPCEGTGVVKPGEFRMYDDLVSDCFTELNPCVTVPISPPPMCVRRHLQAQRVRGGRVPGRREGVGPHGHHDGEAFIVEMCLGHHDCVFLTSVFSAAALE